MISLLFVCMGNICRSPALQAIFEHIAKTKGTADQFFVDSCGLNSYFLGQDPDRRIQEIAQENGVHMEHQAKLFETVVFDQFDMILAVTHEVREHLLSLSRTSDEKKKIYLATVFSKLYPNEDIPDPYYGHEKAFENVWKRCEDAAEGLYETLSKKL